jgi:hypothetical protein
VFSDLFRLSIDALVGYEIDMARDPADVKLEAWDTCALCADVRVPDGIPANGIDPVAVWGIVGLVWRLDCRRRGRYTDMGERGDGG